MTLAATLGSPIRRTVLNDVGPFIAATALRRLGTNLDMPDRRFETLQDAESHYVARSRRSGHSPTRSGASSPHTAFTR